MTTLRQTHPHFVRCIIPNETKSPGIQIICYFVIIWNQKPLSHGYQDSIFSESILDFWETNDLFQSNVNLYVIPLSFEITFEYLMITLW